MTEINHSYYGYVQIVNFIKGEIKYLKARGDHLTPQDLYREQEFLILKVRNIGKRFCYGNYDLYDDHADATGGICHTVSTDGMIGYLADDKDTCGNKDVAEEDQRTINMLKQHPSNYLWYIIDNVDDMDDPEPAKASDLIEIYNNILDDNEFESSHVSEEDK